jgi:hypothetical protein
VLFVDADCDGQIEVGDVVALLEVAANVGSGC